jgi:hypothetical protein
MFKYIHTKAGILLEGLLLVIVAVAIAQTNIRSYLPVAIGPDGFFVGSEEREPNNSFEQANGALKPDFVYTALPNDTDDFFYFHTVEEEGEVIVDVLGLNVTEAEISLYLEVEGSPPELIASSDSAPPDIHLEDHGPLGKYYVVVHISESAPPPPRDSTPYTLRIDYTRPVTPTPDPGTTPRPTASTTPTPTLEPTREGTTPTATLGPTDRPTTDATPGATGSPTPTTEATPTVPGDIPALQNPSFESGTAGWEQTSSTGHELIIHEDETPLKARTGDWLARLGQETGEVSRLGQSVAVPGGTGPFYLRHYAILQSDEDECDPDADTDTIELHINGEMVAEDVLCHSVNPAEWKRRNWDAIDLSQYAGETIFLEIVVVNNDVADSVSTVYIDDASLVQE